jgi:hypothetical protein
MSDTPPPEWSRKFFIRNHMNQFESKISLNFLPSSGTKIVSSIIGHLNQNPPELGKTGNSMEIECLVEGEKITLKINPIGIRWESFDCFDLQCQKEFHNHYDGDWAHVLVYIDEIAARIMIRMTDDSGEGTLYVVSDGTPKFEDERIGDFIKWLSSN